jgi:hypothetical protein
MRSPTVPIIAAVVTDVIEAEAVVVIVPVAVTVLTVVLQLASSGNTDRTSSSHTPMYINN